MSVGPPYLGLIEGTCIGGFGLNCLRRNVFTEESHEPKVILP